MRGSEQPTVSLSPDQKRALLERLLRERAEASATRALSYGQRALWFLFQLAPESSAYNVPQAWCVSSSVRIDVLRRAFQALVDRHAALRSRYPAVDGEPRVEIERQRELDFAEVDASSWADDELTSRVRLESARPFDLERGPVMRVRLFRRTARRHVLLVTFHHIAYDLRSMTTLMSDLTACYSAYLADATPSLPPMRFAYADYVRWQHELLRSEEGERLWQFWQNRLGGTLPVLQLPTDRPRPAVQTYRGGWHASRLGDDLVARLQTLALAQGSTLFAVLATCFAALLQRLTGQDDLLIGSPMGGRSKPEFDAVVGYFLNPLPLRIDLSGDPEFAGLLRQVRRTVVDVLDHQDFPLELLAERLHPVRSASHSPLFQVMFSFNQHRGGPNLIDARPQDLPLETFPLEQQTAQLDLTLRIDHFDAGVLATWEYSTDLFDASTIERWAGHFERLLESACLGPDRRLSQLPLWTDAQARRSLQKWSASTMFDAPDLSLHELFERQVARTPDAVAVLVDGRSMTYRQVEDRANQVAHHLRALGVGPGTTVAIGMDRSLELVAALLGILKAGAAYLPLDPAYPLERLAYMLEDARVTTLLTDTASAARLPSVDARVVCLDPEWTAVERSPATPVGGPVQPDDLAYVIYTSGSTGRPKGVQIPHRAIANLLASMRERPGLAASDTLVAVTTLSFDIAALELFLPLIVGGRLALANRETAADPRRLMQALADTGASAMQATPATWRMLLGAAWTPPAGFRGLCGGEAMPRELARDLVACGIELWNMYGPTETTVWSTLDPVTTTDGPVTIGRPIANTYVEVLDRAWQPAPDGTIGEIAIGGYGLARGYLNRADLTADRFVPDPLAAEPGARLYRTGDLGRWRSDGRLECLGRLDHQVKIRGFRIELGEIETALIEDAAVKAAVVVARADRPGDSRLVAYVVLEETPGASDDSIDGAAARTVVPRLRRHLSDRLPDYMVPSAFVVLDSIPLTPNGKVDRRALPAPDPNRTDVETVFIAPRSPIEEGLVDIWSAVLGLSNLGIHDNFFEAGGHSLVATQVVSRARDVFQVELPVRALFETPTIAGLAATIERLYDTPDRMPLAPPVSAGPREAPLPLSFAQERLWLVDQLNPGDVAYNMPGAFRLRGALDVEALRRSVREIVRRHEVLRTTFPAKDGVPEQSIQPASTWDPTMGDLSGTPDEGRDAAALDLARAEAHRPFDLAHGPLFRATIVRLAPDDHLLLLTAHHSVFDGWSIGLLMRELSALYAAFADGRPSPLPDPTLQYVDFARWQREWLRGESLECALAYWKRHLAGSQAFELPTDRPRPPVRSSRGAVESFEVPPALSQAAEALGRREGTTLFMTLFAVFAALLHRRTGREDVAVGSGIAGRGQREIEALIGFFVNTVALRLDVSGDPTFRDLLGRARLVALNAYSHQDVPFEKLVEELQIPRDRGRNPLFEVFFNVFDLRTTEFTLPGLALEVVPLVLEATKFDLTLVLYRHAQGMTVLLTYDPDVFYPATIRTLAEQFRRVLEAAVRDPGVRLSELPLLAAAESAELISAFNDGLE